VSNTVVASLTQGGIGLPSATVTVLGINSTSGANATKSNPKADSKADQKTDTKADTKTDAKTDKTDSKADKPGTKNEPAKKMYCN
jgi:hypothetical protein